MTDGETTEAEQAAGTVVDPPLADQPTAMLRPVRDGQGGPDSRGGRATPLPTAITTAAEAMRDEEVHRTRVFIRLGWLASVAGLGAVPFVDGERHVTIAFIAALVLGMVVSFGFHQAFADPRRYTPRALAVLGVMATANAHVAILYFGAFTLAPLLLTIGLHFIGRSELAVRRVVLVAACACHAAIAIVLIAGGLDDPGVFATARPIGTLGYVIGALYVQAAYGLAYATGRNQRRASLRSIEQLARATRIASQRSALLDELRADLARAAQSGAGRHTGEVLGGYRLGAVIDRGAHGEVYDARQVDTDEPAAVKLLRGEHADDATLVARFVREVRATAAVASPHIVRVLATSEPDAARPYLVLERLTGRTLAEQLRRTPTLARAELQRLVVHVGAALDAASAAGIVHRDLKPQNVIDVDGTWKVLDFGVAILGEHTQTLTRGGLVGTPLFMAPEQARGLKLDGRADLHALGAIAYRAATGRNPFGGGDVPAILYAVAHAMPEAPSALVDVPAEVDRWAAIALAKDPAARFATGRELATALAAALDGALAPELRARADALIAARPWRGEA